MQKHFHNLRDQNLFSVKQKPHKAHNFQLLFNNQQLVNNYHWLKKCHKRRIFRSYFNSKTLGKTKSFS